MVCFRRLRVLFIAVCLLSLASTAFTATEIPSFKVEKGPIVDGVDNDVAWKGVTPTIIVDKTSGKSILIRSVYTVDLLFFQVEFPDDAENFLHKPWIWNAADKNYEVGPQREDTFVFKWNMMGKDVDLSNFSDDSYRADIWYWKANRTNPSGFADDKMQVLADPSVEYGTEILSNTGKKRYLVRLGDAGTPPFETYTPTAYEGDLVNAFPPATPEGSRADVHAKGVWRGGFQSIEFARALHTGHEDDVQFDPAAGKSYLFGVSIFSLYGNRLLDISTPNLYGMGRISKPLRLKFY